MRTYTELSKLGSFEERFRYLQLGGEVGKETFGFDRWINQRFYQSVEWKRVRNEVIFRDNGCDLGLVGHEIYGKLLIHHMNPITSDDICNVTDILLNPEYLICVSPDTHNAIHYGDEDILLRNADPIERKPNDTCPWRNYA